MDDELDDHTPEEIARGSQDYFEYLEECDSQEVNYNWEALVRGSVILYDFREY
jgi:hypothetical protein